jgi:hypothetical protein
MENRRYMGVLRLNPTKQNNWGGREDRDGNIRGGDI